MIKNIENIDIESIVVNKDNIRRECNEDDLTSLANSIKKAGIIVPLILKADKSNPGKFIILAGHRRYLAARKAGVTQLPYITCNNENLSDKEIMLIENVHREELPVMEVAKTLKALYEEYGSYTKISQNTGLSLSFIRSRISFVNELDTKTQEKLSNGALKPNQIIEARPIKAIDEKYFNLILKNCEDNILNNAMKIRHIVKFIKENQNKIDDVLVNALINTEISETECEYLLTIDDTDIRNVVLYKITNENYKLSKAIELGNSLIYEKNTAKSLQLNLHDTNTAYEYVTNTLMKICDKFSELNHNLKLDQLDNETKGELKKYLRLITHDIDRFIQMLENGIVKDTSCRKNLFKVIIGGKK